MATAADVRAEIFPRQNEFQANAYTTGAQRTPDVAALRSGGFVVVWESSQQDESADGIFLRRFGEEGAPTLARDVRVNATTIGPQELPSVTAGSGDDTLVVWVDAGGQTRVVGRLFSGTTPASPEFQISSIDEPYLGRRPSAAFQADGGFVVVWNGYEELGLPPGNALLVRRFDSDGEPIAPARRVRDLPNGELASPALAAIGPNNVVLVWNEDKRVIGRRYNTAQDLFALSFEVSGTDIEGETFPSIAADAAGKILVAWERDGDVYARRFDARQRPLTDEFMVNTTTTGTQERPVVVFDSNGGFVVAWTTFEKDAPGQDGSGAAVFAQRYTSEGVPDGTEFQVNTETQRSQQDPAITADDGGGVTMVWESQVQDGSALGVFGQRFLVAVEGECGDPVSDDSGGVTVADALFVLRSAVDAAACALCACDVDGNADITATDAVLTLRMALDVSVEPACPACGG